MRRWIRTVLITGLTLSAIATGGLWLASRSQRLSWRIIDSDSAWLSIDCHLGRFTAYYLTYNFDGRHAYLQQTLRPGALLQHAMLRNNIDPRSLRRLRGRFQLRLNPRGKLSNVRYVAFPLWAPLILFIGYPAVGLIRGPLRRGYRRKHGLCVKCGYDLTGNVTRVCSECGEETAGGPVKSRIEAVRENPNDHHEAVP